MKNEKLNETKDEMIKRTKKIGDTIETLVILLIIMITLGVIVGIIGGIAMLSDGATLMETINEMGAILNIKLDFSTMSGIAEIFSKVITIALSIVALLSLAKIFKNTAKEGTPFSLDNIKNMKKVSTCAIINFWVTLFLQTKGIGAVYVIAICGMEYIFRYGYKLQVESDETL